MADNKKEERRIPYFINYEDEHMRIKHEWKLTKYQLRFFTKELERRKKYLEKLEANTELRKKAYKCDYSSVEELNQAYIVGAIQDDKEYMRQRSALWQVYSDRGHLKEIEWLEAEILKYQRKMDAIESIMQKKKKRNHEEWDKMVKKRRRKAATMRRYRRRRKQAELEERWKRHGIG